MEGITIPSNLRRELDSLPEKSRSPWYIQTVIYIAGLLSVAFFCGFFALLLGNNDDMIFPIGIILTIIAVGAYYYLPKENDYIHAVLFALLATGESLIFAHLYESTFGISLQILFNILLFIFYPLFTARLLIPGVIMLLSIALVGMEFNSYSKLSISNMLALLSLFYSFLLIITYIKGIKLSRVIPGGMSSIRAGLFLAVLCAENPVNLAETLFWGQADVPLWQSTSFLLMIVGQIIYTALIVPFFLSIYPTKTPQRKVILTVLIISILLGLTSVRIMVALQLLLAAHMRSDRKFQVSASIFLLIALSTYYYSLHITLLVKSLIMISTGAISLTGWYFIRKKGIIHE